MKKQQLLLSLFLFCSMLINAQKVMRIVSLTPSLTASILLLESRDKLVGCTSYCQIGEGKDIQRVGSAVNASIEKIVSLKPDLVVTTTMAKPKTVDLLKKMGIAVEMFPTPNSFSEICSQFIRLGELLGKKPLATNMVESEKIKLDSLQQKMKNGGRKIFFQIGAKPLFTVIPNTFMNDYISFAGCENVSDDLTKGTITRESVVMRNPDVIFIATMGLTGEDEIANWKNYPHINAVKNNKLFVIKSELACTPTPTNFTKTFEQMLEYLTTP